MNSTSPARESGALVSVIIPTYNRASLLIETLDSLIAQSYRPIEAVVVDDGSTDDTSARLDRLRARAGDLQVRCLSQQRQGAPAARNRGIAESRGEYLVFLDSDDLLASGAVTALVSALNAAPEHSAAYGDWQNLVKSPLGGYERERRWSRGPFDDFVAAALAGRHPVASCYLYRRAAVPPDSWNTALPANQDYDFVLRLALRGLRFLFVPDALICYYRQHDDQRITRIPGLDKAKVTARILDEAAAILDAGQGWTPGRRQAFADSYYLIGQAFYEHERGFYNAALARARQVCPGFLPSKRGYRALARLIGCERVEALAAWRRRRLDRR